ncbi:MAG: hypothetical protein HKL90_09190 [Elusimicrobia bacterium]|nr:hypothetical protein [Elusimicrobiota bacterium]
MNLFSMALLLAASLCSAQTSAPPSLGGSYRAALALIDGAFATMPGGPLFPDESIGGEVPESTVAAPRGFRLVSPGLYRSAQPSLENIGWLSGFGMATLLDLRDPITAALERRAAARAGIGVKSVPMSGLWAPTFGELDRALAVLTDPATPRPILVHCLHGQDRTGVVIAAYRVIVEGVPPARAADEAQGFGCCHLVSRDLRGLLERYRRHVRRELRQ